MKNIKTLARLLLFKRLGKDAEFEHHATYELTSFVIRIGRSTACEIVLDASIELFRAVSRKHCSLFYYPYESNDFYVMDGVTDEATTDAPNPIIIPSQTGVYINNQRLKSGEKHLLKHNDEFYLIPNRLKFLYCRPQNKISDNFKDTYIPEEYR